MKPDGTQGVRAYQFDCAHAFYINQNNIKKKGGKMKRVNFKTMILVVVAAVSFGSFNALAEDEVKLSASEDEVKPSASADVAFLSKYVWRGWELSKDSLVIQPSITAEYKGFSMNLWGNLDTDNKVKEEADFNETDLTVAYDTSVGDFDIGVGYIYYALDGPDTQEFYASVCAAAIPLAPTLTVYKDFTQFIGWYLNLGLSHSFEFEKGITLDLGASAGYYYSEDDDFTEVGGDRYRNFHDGNLSVGLTVPIDKYITITPMMAYSFPLGGEADDRLSADSFSGDDSDLFYGGVTLSIAF